MATAQQPASANAQTVPLHLTLTHITLMGHVAAALQAQNATCGLMSVLTCNTQGGTHTWSRNSWMADA